LLGNVTSSSDPTGKSLTNTVTGGASTAVTTTTFGAAGAGTITFRVSGSGLAAPVDLSLVVAAGTTIDTALASLQTAVANNSALQTAGITVTTAAAGSALVLTDKRGEAVDIASSGDLKGLFGLGSFRGATGAGGSFDYTSVTGSAGAFTAAASTLEFSLSGGAKVSITTGVPTAATEAATIVAINNALAGNTTLSGAGFYAVDNAGQIKITNNSNTNFRLATIGAANDAGFNAATATGLAQTANTQSAATTIATFDTGGAYQTSVLDYAAQRLGTDKQTITLTSDDNNGVQQSLAINLQNAGTPNARTLDETIASINSALLQSNNATLQKIVAVKEQNGSNVEGIKFVGVKKFQVSVGATGSGAGIGSQGTLQAAGVVGAGSTADISTQNSAQDAVNALAAAVTSLGSAQAVVGRGQNQFGYAINLASSQLTNLAASESRIRDADLASEAANLTKAQTLLQAGIAALAQANSAPQAVLSLLRG
jgi:flagellin